ncbi:MAG: hypothetical protein RHS_5238 [Robinsoniella sp. RHS]|nr:MAG: hypothetical protein RHS_5238 [Robinsoniella sp. RHS]
MGVHKMNNWKKLLENNITTAKELKEVLKLSNEEVIKMEEILEHYPMSVPLYYFSLIHADDPDDPVRKMCIPNIRETDLGGSFDTSGEASNTVIVGMQHKYRETVLILSTNQCAMYCRHCFRKRLVGLSDEEIASHFDEMIQYIKNHSQISNVLISGGDAFLNDDEVIEQYLYSLSRIEHIDCIRFGTRTPVTFPDRILEDPDLINILRTYSEKKQIYVVTHFNHPNEITEKSKAAVRSLIAAGILVRNQTVLIKGVNDHPQTLGTLLKNLTRIGIVPYYVFQCRPVTGVKSQFQVPLKRGCDIVDQAKNMQNGLGKCIRYILSHETGKIEILGSLNAGEVLFKYHQAKDEEDYERIFTKKIEEGQCWL